MLVCLFNLYRVQLASKGILVGSARVVGDFYPASLVHRVVVEVDIGAFVEAMVWRDLGGWGNVVVNVCEKCQKRHLSLLRGHGVWIARVNSGETSR